MATAYANTELLSCVLKKRYEKWHDANYVLKCAIERKNYTHRGYPKFMRLKVYRCRNCRGWHLGTSKPDKLI